MQSARPLNWSLLSRARWFTPPLIINLRPPFSSFFSFSSFDSFLRFVTRIRSSFARKGGIMLDARYWGRTMGYFNTVYRGGEAGLGSNKCDSDMIVGKDACAGRKYWKWFIWKGMERKDRDGRREEKRNCRANCACVCVCKWRRGGGRKEGRREIVSRDFWQGGVRASATTWNSKWKMEKVWTSV